MSWYEGEVDNGRLSDLRRKAAQARQALLDAEARLVEQRRELRQFEAILERRLGKLIDDLAVVEAELAHYYDLIARRRNEQQFGSDYRSVDEQYRRVWRKPAGEQGETLPPPVPSLSEGDLKRLYRKLARQLHPDLAADETERQRRTAKMTALNDAYAARSTAELLALAEEVGEETAVFLPNEPHTRAEMAYALEADIARCQLRVQEIGAEMQNFHHHPIVQLSLETKLARRQGQNLLAEMAQKLQRKLAQKSAERNMIKAQFDNLESS